MNEEGFFEEFFKAMGSPVLNNLTKKYLVGRTPLLDAIPKLDLTGKSIMDDDEEETGIDLSEVPMCVHCGLEMANKYEHEIWHQQQEGRIHELQAKVDALETRINSLIQTVQAANQPDRYGRPLNDHWHHSPNDPRYISQDEIDKYGKGLK